MATGRLPDPNTAPLTAKGDLYTYSTVPARLAVGSNGETLVADSSATTGLRWSADWNTGKNKIINGDFNINQRGFSSTTTSGTFGFDRFYLAAVDGTSTYSTQAFTLGTAPVAGYEGRNFARLVSTGQTSSTAFTAIAQPIESVRTFAGQTIVVSFWAKASSGTPNIIPFLDQSFGSGGSPSATVQVSTTKQAITTSWARYSFTFNVPSISGKTIGTSGGDYLNLYIVTSAGSSRNSYTDSLGIQSATIDIWGVQAEAGSVATPFTTATGTLAGELAACQRYYYRIAGNSAYSYTGYGTGYSTTVAYYVVPMKQTMRVEPTAIDYANIQTSDFVNAGINFTALTIDSPGSGPDFVMLQGTVASGLTQYRSYYLNNSNNAAGYIGFSSEL